MENIDARKLKPQVQEQLRKQVVRLRHSGKSYKEIGEIVGIHPTNACKIFKAYEKGGANAIKAKTRGRKQGSCRTLTPEQEKQVKRTITDRTPDQLVFPFALWTRRAVKELVRQLFSIDMPIRTVGEYLNRWGFAPQKPLRRAYEQNPKAVQKWLDEEYPSIVEMAKKEQAEINWGDETDLCNADQRRRCHALKGMTPVVTLNAKRESISLISSIANQGMVRFMLYDKALDAQVFIKFCSRLIKDAGKKIYLILDNLRVHHCKLVKEWVEQHSDRIQIFFLPSYSSELNPDEYLNCDRKTGVHYFYQNSFICSRKKAQ